MFRGFPVGMWTVRWEDPGGPGHFGITIPGKPLSLMETPLLNNFGGWGKREHHLAFPQAAWLYGLLVSVGFFLTVLSSLALMYALLKHLSDLCRSQRAVGNFAVFLGKPH